MKGKQNKNAVEKLASHRIHGILPKKYHMKYRSGQEELVEEASLKEMEQLIRRSSGDLDVPEELLPDNIGQKLAVIQHKKKKRQRCFLAAGVVLSVCVVVFAVLAWKNHQTDYGSTDLNHIYSYGQLYDYYTGLSEQRSYSTNLGALMSGSAAADTGSTGLAQQKVSVPDYFTSANVREEGIGEGDFTVTDGEYIYTLHQIADREESSDVDGDDYDLMLSGYGLFRYYLRVTISRIEGERVTTVATFQKEYKNTISYRKGGESSIYLYGDVLVLVYSDSVEDDGWQQRTCLDFYDVSDRSNPKLVKEEVQNGWYQECREKDGFLYVISTKPFIPVNELKREKEERYIPMADGEKLPLQDIYLQEESQGNAYQMISSWDLSKQGERIDVKAMIGEYSDIYMTADNIYFSETVSADRDKKDKTDRTRISKLSCRKGEIKAVAAVYFPGVIDSSFALQERGEELWVTAQVRHYVYREDLEKKEKKKEKATQTPDEKTGADEESADVFEEEDEFYEEWDGAKVRLRATGEDDVEDLDYWYGEEEFRSWTEVSVHTFDSRLNSLDSLDGLARDEEIFAVRYIGQTGYFVSYEQTDPLVSVDFSDSRHLKVLDELVMPGFSTYLHPVQDDLLLGVGFDESGEVKLDLYDVSDPKKLSRLDKRVLKDLWDCAVFEDYKWFMVDAEHQLFGVSATSRHGSVFYLLYHYDRREGLQQVKKVKLGWENDSIYASIWQGFRVGDDLYLVGKSESSGIKVVELS